MAWDDIEHGMGRVSAIPGKILGAVADPLKRSLRSNPGARNLISSLPAAYAMGRGQYEAASQMQQMQQMRRDEERTRQRMAEMNKRFNNTFRGGFDPSIPAHAAHALALLTEAYPGEDALKHYERVLGLHSQRQQVSAQAEGEWKNITINTEQGERVIQVDKNGNTRELFGTGANQGTPYTQPKYSEVGPLRDAWVNSDEHERFSEMSERLSHIESSYADAVRTRNPLAFTTAVTALAKILDPEGVVRDSDFQVIASTQSLVSQLQTNLEGKLAGELDAEDTAIMGNILSQARLLARASAEGNIGTYNRQKELYMRGVVDPQPEGRRVFEENNFPGVNPQDLIDRVNQAAGSSPPQIPAAGADQQIGTTPTGEPVYVDRKTGENYVK